MTGTVPATAAGCAACGAACVSPLVCAECGVIFEIPSDPFATFGLARSWAVDATALEQRYDLISRVFREKSGDAARLAAVVLEAEEKIASSIMAAGQSFTRLERSRVEELGAAADALAEARLWRQKVDELRATLGG